MSLSTSLQNCARYRRQYPSGTPVVGAMAQVTFKVCFTASDISVILC